MKIAIIEDRISRLEHYSELELNKYKSISIITGLDFDELFSELKNKQTQLLDQFECICSHRSAFTIETRDLIKEYCKQRKKPLVFFSGGISSNVYKDFDFPCLHINSKDFYSINLIYFIESTERGEPVNLLLIQFGKRWKLSLLMNLRNKISVALNKEYLKRKLKHVEIDDSELIKRVRDLQINLDLKADLIDDKTKDIFSGNDFSPVSYEQIQNLKNVLDRLINEMT